jgi:hypothetical protein
MKPSTMALRCDLCSQSWNISILSAAVYKQFRSAARVLGGCLRLRFQQSQWRQLSNQRLQRRFDRAIDSHRGIALPWLGAIPGSQRKMAVWRGQLHRKPQTKLMFGCGCA